MNSFPPRDGVCSATMSAFMTKPPAATTTDPARTTPVSWKHRHAAPTTSPADEATRFVTPVS